MRFYDKLFASYWAFETKLRDRSPKLAGFLAIAASQIMILGVLLGLLRRSSISIFALMSPDQAKTLYFTSFAISTTMSGLYFYTGARMDRAINRYSEMTETGKIIWGVIAALLLIVPPGLFPIIFSQK